MTLILHVASLTCALAKAAFAQSRSSSASSPSESMSEPKFLRARFCGTDSFLAPDCTKDPSFWTQSKVRTGEAAQFDCEFVFQISPDGY